jgi:hypothetical protein
MANCMAKELDNMELSDCTKGLTHASYSEFLQYIELLTDYKKIMVDFTIKDNDKGYGVIYKIDDIVYALQYVSYIYGYSSYYVKY